MDVGASFVPSRQPSEGSVKPGEGAFDDPTIATESFLRLDSASSNPRRHVSHCTRSSTEDVIVRLVCMQLAGAVPAMSSRSTGRHDCIEHRTEHVALRRVGPRQTDRERGPSSVDDQVLLRAEFSAVRRVRARLFAPPFARTLDASSEARDQSIFPSLPSSSRTA